MNDLIQASGEIEITVENVKTGEIVYKNKSNTVLTNGKTLIAKALTNSVNSPFDFYANEMAFGTGGEDGSVQKVVDASRSTLYNEVISVAVSRSWDSDNPTRASFVATLGVSQANLLTINEAGLRMADGTLFSMTTFPGLSKTDSLQFTLNWSILIV